MRFKEITLSGFRAFAATTTVHLDADCIILVGTNGQGKTSLLDGLFWALTGHLGRIGKDESLVSLYSETGGATVSLTLSDGGNDLVIFRRFDGDRTSLVCRLGDRTLEHEEVRSRYGALIALPGESREELAASMAATMARSLYLQQDSIRDFISADTDDSRFRVVADLCGVGRATDLQATLQRERRAWTQATNKFVNQVRSNQLRVSGLRERSSEFGSTTHSEKQLSDEWKWWWTRLEKTGATVGEATPEWGASDASASLDRAIRLLESAKLRAERRRAGLVEGIRKARIVVDDSPTNEVQLKEAVEGARQLEEEFRRAFHDAEAKNSVAQEELLRAKISADELRTLSELALRHLSDRCPVCDQLIDREETAASLRRYMNAQPASTTPLEDLKPLLTHVTAAQQETLKRIKALREAEAKNAHTRQIRAELAETVATLEVESGIPIANLIGEMERLQLEVVDQLQELSSIRAAADDLALAVARTHEWAQREEVMQQLKVAEKELEQTQNVVAARERAGRVATTIIEEIREASLQIVDEELHRVEPLLQRIWSGIDPHPSLRVVNLVSRLSYGKGRLSMEVRDEIGDVFSESPQTVLSSSQLNALAVALFLTLNLGTQSPLVPATVLDDPFQALDEVNLLGLIDLLRRVRAGRQLILATHERKFGQLLARKLRPIDMNQTTRLIEFDSWDRTGPKITERVIGRDLEPFRFVA